MRALVRGTLPPGSEMSMMYTSIAATLIESAAPLSLLGIGLVVASARKVPSTVAFAYVWNMLCVESKSSHTPFRGTPEKNCV
jgi:hypothetical protein